MAPTTRIAILLLAAGAAVPAQTPAPATAVTGVGNFSHIVADMDRSLAFYRDAIGLELYGPIRPFDGNPAIMTLANTPGGQSRYVTLRVPGSQMGVEIIEFKSVDRKPVNPGLQDPGAASLSPRVRDMDSIVTRAKQAGARVWTKGGAPLAVSGDRRIVYLKDPDGFFVELIQGAPSAGQSNIIGGSFLIVVEDSAKTLKFYREALGFQTQERTFTDPLPLLMDLWGVPGAQFQRHAATIPGTTVGMSFHEFTGVKRAPVRTRTQDPGTPILQLRVRDVEALTKSLKDHGAEVIGGPVSLGNAKLALVRGPDNLFLELLPSPPAQ